MSIHSLFRFRFRKGSLRITGQESCGVWSWGGIKRSRNCLYLSSARFVDPAGLGNRLGLARIFRVKRHTFPNEIFNLRTAASLEFQRAARSLYQLRREESEHVVTPRHRHSVLAQPTTPPLLVSTLPAEHLFYSPVQCLGIYRHRYRRLLSSRK